MDNADFNINSTERITPKDVSNHKDVLATPAVITEKNENFEIIDVMISDMVELSREEIISDIVNTQGDINSNPIKNLGVKYSCSNDSMIGKMENSQKRINVDSNLIQGSSNMTSDMRRKTEEYSKIEAKGQNDILPNQKESSLPPNVVKVLKNVLGTSSKKQPNKPKIIVAKVPTSKLKQIVASKDNVTYMNKDNITNMNKLDSLQSGNLTPNLSRVILLKASNQVKKKPKVLDETRLKKTNTYEHKQSNVNYYSQKTERKQSNANYCSQKTTNEVYLPRFCPSDLSISKYYCISVGSTEFENLENTSSLDFGEYILSSSKKCLLLTMPYSPGYEEEKTTNVNIIAEESGTLSSFEFTEACELEKEFNKMFHHCTCIRISDTTPRETIMQFIFETMKRILCYPIEDSLKLTCNCSLCWFLYVRGKIISTYYPNQDLSCFHIPLASYLTVAIRDIVITDLELKADDPIVGENHYFLPIRFKRGGKKRDLTKQTMLCDSYNPHLSGYVPRNRGVILRDMLSPHQDTNDIIKQLIENSGIVTNSVVSATSNGSRAETGVTSMSMPSHHDPLLKCSFQIKKNVINLKSSVTSAKTTERVNKTSPAMVYSESKNKSCSKSLDSLKSYDPVEIKKSYTESSASTSQILSSQSENSVILSNPISIDLNEIKKSGKIVSNDNTMETKSDFVASKINDACDKLVERVDGSVKEKETFLNPKKMDSMNINHKSGSQMFDQFEEQSSVTNIPVGQSTLSSETNLNDTTVICRSDLPISHDLVRVNKSEIEMSHLQKLAECPKSVSDLPVCSNSISTNLKKQTETSNNQESKKCAENVLESSVSPNAIELLVEEWSEGTCLEETMDSHKSDSSGSDIEQNVEFDSNASELQKEIEGLLEENVESTCKSSSSIKHKTELSNSIEKPITLLTNIKETQLSNLPSSGVKRKFDSSNSIANEQQKQLKFITKTEESHLPNSPRSGIKRKFEFVVHDSTAGKLQKQTKITLPQAKKGYNRYDYPMVNIQYHFLSDESHSTASELKKQIKSILDEKDEIYKSAMSKRKFKSSVKSISTGIQTSHIQESLQPESSKNAVNLLLNSSVSTNASYNKDQTKALQNEASNECLKFVASDESSPDMQDTSEMHSDVPETKKPTSEINSNVSTSKSTSEICSNLSESKKSTSEICSNLSESKKSTPEISTSEICSNLSESKKSTSEISSDMLESKKPTSEIHSNVSETEKLTSEVHSNVSETKKSTSQINSNVLEIKSLTSEMCTNLSQTKNSTSETNSNVSESKSRKSEICSDLSETKKSTSETNSNVSESKSRKSETCSDLSETKKSTSETNSNVSESKKSSKICSDLSETKKSTSETNSNVSESKSSTSEICSDLSETKKSTPETNSSVSESKKSYKICSDLSETKKSTSSKIYPSETKKQSSEIHFNASETEKPSSEILSDVSESKKSREEKTIADSKLNKHLNKTLERISRSTGIQKCVSSGLNIIKVSNSPKKVKTLPNILLSKRATNTTNINIPNDSPLKMFGVSNSASTVNFVKLPNSLQTLPVKSSSSGTLKIVKVKSDTGLTQNTNLANPVEFIKIPSTRAIKVVNVPSTNTRIVEFARLIGPLPRPSFHSGPVKVVPDAKSNAASVKDSSNQKISESIKKMFPELENVNSNKNLENIKNVSDNKTHRQSLNSESYSGFRGFKS